MPNHYFSEVNKLRGGKGGGVKPKRGVAPAASLPSDKTASWPGLPGKTQPKDRSGGVKRVRQHPKSDGI